MMYQIDLQATVEWTYEDDSYPTTTTVTVSEQYADPDFFNQIGKMITVGGYKRILLEGQDLILTYSALEK